MKKILLILALALVGCPSDKKSDWVVPTPDYVCPDEWRSTGRASDGFCFTCPEGWQRRMEYHDPDWAKGRHLCEILADSRVLGQCTTFCAPGEGWGTCDPTLQWKTMWCEQ